MDRHFTGTTSRVGGVGLDTLAREALDRHARAYPAADLRAAALRRRLRLAPRRRVPRLEPGDDRHAPARRARRATAAAEAYERFARYVNDEAVRNTALRGLLRFRDDVEPMPLDEVEPAKEIVRALQVRRHVARRAVAGGPRDPRRGHEPPRRQVEHRRGRGGRGALRRRAPLVDQAGGLGPLRRDRPLPRQRRRAPDQGRPGRQARRGRPAARPQGGRLHRRPALLDAGRGADLAAAAPRHLLDRGPQAADLRPALREPARAHLGEARVARSAWARSRPAWPRPTPTTW